MIISFSGKKRSGKDTAGKIAQILLSFNKISNEDVIKYLDGGSFDNPKWKIKKWATYLKQIVANLSGCTLAEMEDEDIKNVIIYNKYALVDKFVETTVEYETVEEAMEEYERRKLKYLKLDLIDNVVESLEIIPVSITRRVMLERIGTEVGRYIHSNIWIDYLMNQYKKVHGDCFENLHFKDAIPTEKEGRWKVPNNPLVPTEYWGKEIQSKEYEFTVKRPIYDYPEWIITDTRFFNEAEKVKSVKGLNIRVNRTIATKINAFNVDNKDYDVLNIKDDGKSIYFVVDTNGEFIREYDCNIIEPKPSTHKSETDLDDYKGFDYYIDNNDTLDNLINRIREILTKENLINA